jgi:dipeptidyl aminopeptidase/acylaminoacyl peptidase
LVAGRSSDSVSGRSLLLGLVLADGTTLWSIPANGGTPIELGGNLASDTRPPKDGVLYCADFLAWPHARDGAADQLAATFGRYRTWMNKRVGVVDVQTGRATLLSPAGMAATSASWSPDDHYLAYSAMPDTGDLVGGDTAQQGMMQRRIYVVNTQGGPQPRQLTADPAYRDELPLWSADGTDILFARLDGQSRASLWLISAAGGEPRQVVDDLPLDPQTAWFGYYGHIDWGHTFDWWTAHRVPLPARASPST